MELACYLKRMSVNAAVEWAPRETNKEADSLANAQTEQFDPNFRVHIGLAQLHWDIFPHASSMGRQAVQAALSAKHEGAYTDRARPQKRRKPEHKLRATDLW